MQRFLLFILWCIVWPVHAEEPELLEPDQAFALTVRSITPSEIEVRYKIADGYYMYRSKFAFEPLTPAMKLGEPAFPRGEIKQDEFFGSVEIYRGDLRIRIPVTGAAARAQLQVNSQGCADIGVCYPPHKQVRGIDLPR